MKKCMNSLGSWHFITHTYNGLCRACIYLIAQCTVLLLSQTGHVHCHCLCSIKTNFGIFFLMIHSITMQEMCQSVALTVDKQQLNTEVYTNVQCIQRPLCDRYFFSHNKRLPKEIMIWNVVHSCAVSPMWHISNINKQFYTNKLNKNNLLATVSAAVQCPRNNWADCQLWTRTRCQNLDSICLSSIQSTGFV